MKAWVREVLEFARDNRLNLGAHKETVPTRIIEVTEGTDPRAVAAIKERLKRSEDLWPKDLPLVVLESNIGEGFANEGYTVLDGHHRLAAAEELGYSEIPALVVSTRAYLKIVDRFDVPRVDYIRYVLAAIDPLIAANVKKGVDGKPKKRLR